MISTRSMVISVSLAALSMPLICALTTEALLSEIKEDDKMPAMPPGGGMGDMY